MTVSKKYKKRRYLKGGSAQSAIQNLKPHLPATHRAKSQGHELESIPLIVRYKRFP